MATSNLNDVSWSIPPITSDPSLPDVPSVLPGPDFSGEMRIPLRKGIICQVNMDRPWLLQNVNDNEDDKIEFSLHGDPDGTWNEFGIGTSVKAGVPMFFLNRTNKDVLYLALFPQ